MERHELPIADDRAAAAVANLAVVLGDNKYYLGRRLAEWAVGAPSLESAVAAAAIAQEELGHTRALYSILEQLPLADAPVALERDGDRERKYCVGFLLEPLATWYQAVAALLLMDGAMTTVLEALEGSSYADLRRRAARILGDEDIHRKYAEGRVRELARTAEGALLEERVAEMLPETLCWFGPPGEEGVEALVAAGILASRNEELRQAFLARLGPLLAEVGLRAPLERSTGGRWEYGELPWSRWNALQRRLEPAPAPAARA